MVLPVAIYGVIPRSAASSALFAAEDVMEGWPSETDVSQLDRLAPAHSRYAQYVSDLANELIRVAGLVIIPCEYFCQIAIHNLRECQINDARVRIAYDVRRDNLVITDSEDLFVSIGRRFLSKYGIEFVDACPATRHERDIGD